MEYEDLQRDLSLIFPVISGKVSMAINRMMSRNLRKAGLEITPEQWTVLAFLWQEDGVSQQKLCDSTFKDKPSMTRLINNLEKQDLVYRKESLLDKRSNLIYLTEKGKDIREKANACVSESVRFALQGINGNELDMVRHHLKIVFANIEKALKERQ